MKTLFIVITSLLTVNCNNIQKINESGVPKIVLQSCSTNFKGAKAKAWEKGSNGNFEVIFEKSKVSATFSADGKVLEIEQEITKNGLSKLVADYIATNYRGSEMTKAAWITLEDRTMVYKIEMKDDTKKFNLFFDSKGRFLMKELTGIN